MKTFRFPRLLGKQDPRPKVPEHEQAARYFIDQVTELVNGLDQLAVATAAAHPATSRHLRLLSQQYAALAVTAVQTWPEAVHRDRS